jgi:hypothetical protein
MKKQSKNTYKNTITLNNLMLDCIKKLDDYTLVRPSILKTPTGRVSLHLLFRTYTVKNKFK